MYDQSSPNNYRHTPSPDRTTNEEKLRDITREFLQQYYTSLGTGNAEKLKELYGHDSTMKHEGLFENVNAVQGVLNIAKALDVAKKQVMRVTVTRYAFVETRNSERVMFHIHVNGEIHIPAEGITRPFTQSFNLTSVSLEQPKKIYILSDIFFWTEATNTVTFADLQAEKATAVHGDNQRKENELAHSHQTFNRMQEEKYEPSSQRVGITPPPDEPKQPVATAGNPLPQRTSRVSNVQPPQQQQHLALKAELIDKTNLSPAKQFEIPSADLLSKIKPVKTQQPPKSPHGTAAVAGSKSEQEKKSSLTSKHPVVEQLESDQPAAKSQNEASHQRAPPMVHKPKPPPTVQAPPKAETPPDAIVAESKSSQSSEQESQPAQTTKTWANIAKGAPKVAPPSGGTVQKPHVPPIDPVQQQQQSNSSVSAQNVQVENSESPPVIAVGARHSNSNVVDQRHDYAQQDGGYRSRDYAGSRGTFRGDKNVDSLDNITRFFMRFNTPPAELLIPNIPTEDAFVSFMMKHLQLDISCLSRKGQNGNDTNAELRAVPMPPRPERSEREHRLLIFMNMSAYPALAKKLASFATSQGNAPFFINFGKANCTAMIKEDTDTEKRDRGGYGGRSSGGGYNISGYNRSRGGGNYGSGYTGGRGGGGYGRGGNRQ